MKENKSLNELKEEINDKRKLVKKFKRIKNLKLFLGVSTLSVPFILSYGFVVGTFYIAGDTLPFVIDEEKKCQMVSLECNSNNTIYKNFYTTSDDVEDNYIKVYSKWEQNKEGMYERTIKEYNLDLMNIDIVNLILEKDFNNIDKMLTDYEEKKEISSEIENKSEEGFIDAKIKILDEENYIMAYETKSDNLTLTIIELVLSFGIGAIMLLLSKHSNIFNRIIMKNSINKNIYNAELKELIDLEMQYEELKGEEDEKRYRK